MRKKTVMIDVRKVLAGIYPKNPFPNDSWPWSFHEPYKGTYLSENKRICGYEKAMLFDSAQAAREYFSSWKSAHKYRLELIETIREKEVPEVKYPLNHPNTIWDSVRENEHSHIATTAMYWFLGELEEVGPYSKATLRKHRKVLLNYGIDINEKPFGTFETRRPNPDNASLLKNENNLMVR